MNCRRVEQLLALHAGGDLAGADEREVTRHLQGCAGCRLLAEGFARTRALLAAHEPPDFDEDFFGPIRRNVMREVDETPGPRGLAPLFSRLFGARPLAYAAASLALLVAAGFLADRVLRDRPDGDAGRREVVSQPVGVTAAPSPHGPVGTPREATAPRTTPPQRPAPAAVAKSQRRPLPSPAKVEQAARTGEPAVRASGPAVGPAPPPVVVASGEMERLSGDLSLNDDAELASHAGAPAEVDDRKVLRIELRTGDPNVRIIWLTPQSGSPQAKD